MDRAIEGFSATHRTRMMVVLSDGMAWKGVTLWRGGLADDEGG
jgi:hypothetical protein